MKLLALLFLFTSGYSLDPLRPFSCANIVERFSIPQDCEVDRRRYEAKLCAHYGEPFERTYFYDVSPVLRKQCNRSIYASRAFITPTIQEEQSLRIFDDIEDYALPSRSITMICRRDAVELDTLYKMRIEQCFPEE